MSDQIAISAYDSPQAISRPLYSPFPGDFTERANITGPAGQKSRATSSHAQVVSPSAQAQLGSPKKIPLLEDICQFEFSIYKSKI